MFLIFPFLFLSALMQIFGDHVRILHRSGNETGRKRLGQPLRPDFLDLFHRFVQLVQPVGQLGTVFDPFANPCRHFGKLVVHRADTNRGFLLELRLQSLDLLVQLL